MSNLRAGSPGGPEIGIEAFRDAVALIRAVAAGDSEGIHAVAAGTDAPRHVACALASLAYLICRRGGLDAAGTDQLLRELSGAAIDTVLDQPQLWTVEGVGRG